MTKQNVAANPEVHHHHHHQFAKDHAFGYWRKYRPIGWMVSFNFVVTNY